MAGDVMTYAETSETSPKPPKGFAGHSHRNPETSPFTYEGEVAGCGCCGCLEATMNRHQRRADLADFRREAHKAHLVTHLIAANADLSRHPLLAKIAAAWTASIPQRKPFCFCCRASFAEAARPGAFLFAAPSGAADIASVSGLCAACWRDLEPADIQRAAARVLARLMPGGRFLDTGQR
jgi:hypothetical protein